MTNNKFQQFADLGYARLVPIIPPDAEISPTSSLHRALNKDKDPRGKAVGVKRFDGLWSGYNWVNYENDEQDLTRWHNMGAGVGIKTGNGLVLIDADTMDHDHMKIIKSAVDKMTNHYGIRVGQFPKCGYLVRTDPDFRYTRIEFGNLTDTGAHASRVEILAEGRQFVADGIHPKTNKPYEWMKGGPPRYADLPYISGDILLAFLEHLRTQLPAATKPHREGATATVSQAALRGKLEHIRAAVEATPNTSNHFPTRESYVQMAYAIKAALPDNQHEAFEIYADWCAKWTDGTNAPDEVRSDWNRAKPPFRVGASFIYSLAEQYGMDWNPAAVWFDEVEEFDDPFAGPTETNTERFKFLNFDEAADTALASSNAPLIKGLIDQGTMIVLYGDSNVGKTFISMDIAYHLAAGREYAGMRVTQGLVVYVAAEGGGGAKKRVMALRMKYGTLAKPDQFRLLPMAVDLRRPDVDMVAFLAALRGLGAPIALVVVDTLSRALAGGDENSSVDMGAIVKHFDAVRGATGAALMVVHHTGKNKANGARGHSLLRAATDTEIEVEEGMVSVTKQRDLDKSWSSGFVLDVVRLGVDADGDDITSCTVDFVSREAAALATVSGDLTVVEEKVLACLKGQIEDFAAVSTGLGVDHILAASDGLLDKMSLETLRSHLRSLKAKGRVVQPKRAFWSIKTGENSSTVSLPLRKRNVFENGETVEKGRETVENIFG